MNDKAKVTLRVATASDCPAMSETAYRSKTSNGYDEAFMQACREELTYTPEMLASGETWLAELEGRLLGFVFVTVENNEAEIEAMASAAAVASSNSDALANSMPVRSHTMCWKFSKASRRPCDISAW